MDSKRKILRVSNYALFNGQDCSNTNYNGYDLSGRDLSGTKLHKTDFSGADLSLAILENAELNFAYFDNADLTGADLTNADLSDAVLVRTDFSGAKLNGAHVYGTSAWNVILDHFEQESLIITPKGESALSVDHLEVAQFMYTILNNGKLRDLLDSTTTKSVLILGRFLHLDFFEEIKRKLRELGYLPILFFFTKPDNKSLINTVVTLAQMSHFVIGDFTHPKIILQEAQKVVDSTEVPFLPIIEKSQYEKNKQSATQWIVPGYNGGMPATVGDFRNKRQVLDIVVYETHQDFLDKLEKIIKDEVEPIEEELKLGPLKVYVTLKGNAASIETINAMKPLQIS